MNNEIWKQLPDYPYYSISTHGNIYSTFSNKLKALKYKPNGYVVVDLSRDGKHYIHHIHRLVATMFIPNPFNKPDVNHIDGNKKNNHASNLEWVTKSENMQHAISTGLCNYTSRITEEHLEYGIYKVLNDGYSIKLLSTELEYSSPRLKILLNNYAKKLGVYEEFINTLKSKKSENQRIPVVQMSLSGEYIKIYISISEASRCNNISSGNIHNAISGKYKHAAGYLWRYASKEEIALMKEESL